MSLARDYIEESTKGLNTRVDLRDKIHYLITLPECAELDSHELSLILEKIIEDLGSES